MSQMEVETEDKKDGSAMDIEPATRTIHHVDEELEKVKQEMQQAKDSYLKSNNEFYKEKWQDLKDHKRILLEERKGLSLQQQTAQSAPSSGNQFITPFTDTLILRPH